MTEPIASATLALLYLAQGHRSRARATLDEVLEREPDNGYALALAARMRSRPSPTLSARFVASSAAGIDIGAGELELSWTIPRELDLPGQRLYVVVGVAIRARPSLHYSSVPCLDRVATQRIPAPLGPASAAVALVASKPGAAIEILALAEPPSW
jgi:hypothetical protein